MATAPHAGDQAPDRPADAEALAALRAGDRRRALTVLMGAHGKAVYRYCLAMTRDPAMADDAHQTVFFQAYEDLERFDGRSALRTWLFGIARHRCLDALKSHRRRTRRFEPLDETFDRPAAVAGPDGVVGARELGAALQGCLETLPDVVRDAVLMRYQAGVSYVEMAALSGERAPTLQARVARALPTLRRCLEQRGVRL